MKNEMNSLVQNDVWDLVELPNGKSTVGCKWVFRKKSDLMQKEKLKDTRQGL